MSMKTLPEIANTSPSPPGSVQFTVQGVTFTAYSNFQSHKSVVGNPSFVCWQTLVRIITPYSPPYHIDAANLDTITYGTTKLGIIRAECVAFAVSPRNSAAGIAYLINKTGTQRIMVTPDLKPLVDATVAILTEQRSRIPVVQPMPTFKDLFPDNDSEEFEYLPELSANSPDDPVCILHSSGV